VRRAAAILAAALAACGGLLTGCGKEEPAPDAPAGLLREIADPRAAAVVTQMLEAYGGAPALARHRNVEYGYRLLYYGGQRAPRTVTRQIHRLGLSAEPRAYIEDLDGPARQIVRLSGGRLEVTRGGRPLPDAALAGAPGAFATLARWSFLNPWNLLEPGSRLRFRGVRTPPPAGAVPAGPCDVIRLTRERPGGAGSGGPEGDWHDFYVSRLSHLIDRVHSHRLEDGSSRVVVWSDHRAFDGLRIALRRETFTADASGALGPLEVAAEYADVRFDLPFGDEIFDRGHPLAASPAPE
jgi:hypothetical protein